MFFKSLASTNSATPAWVFYLWKKFRREMGAAGVCARGILAVSIINSNCQHG